VTTESIISKPIMSRTMAQMNPRITIAHDSPDRCEV
jgi:hypothetical protein